MAKKIYTMLLLLGIMFINIGMIGANNMEQKISINSLNDFDAFYDAKLNSLYLSFYYTESNMNIVDVKVEGHDGKLMVSLLGKRGADNVSTFKTMKTPSGKLVVVIPNISESVKLLSYGDGNDKQEIPVKDIALLNKESLVPIESANKVRESRALKDYFKK